MRMSEFNFVTLYRMLQRRWKHLDPILHPDDQESSGIQRDVLSDDEAVLS